MRLRRRTFLAGAGLALAGACRRGRAPGELALPPSEPLTVTAEVDLERTVGSFSRLSGAQGSPLPEVAGDVDHRARFTDVGLVNVRLPQDCAPNTLTLGGIFPDERADPSRAESYRFEAIDAHLDAARAAGAQVLWQSSYDVGRTDRWVGWNLGGRAPSDLARWSKVVTRCLEHFNNGWARGGAARVRHVEFVNEPDGLGGFGRDGKHLAAAFEAFLGAIASYNQAHPDTRVTAVGPGVPLSFAEWDAYRPRFSALLARLVADGATLPVFSFHTYGKDTSPAGNARLAVALRELLDGHGLKTTPLWNTEWQGTEHVRRLVAPARATTGDPTEDELRTFASGLATYALCCKVRWQGLLGGAYYYRANARVFPEGVGPPLRRLGYGVYFSPSGETRPLGLHEKLLKRLEERTALRTAVVRASDDGADAMLATRSEDGRAGVLLCNLGLQPRRFGVRLVGPTAERLSRAALVELGPGTTALVATPGPALERTTGGVSLSLVVGALSSGLVELDA